MFNKKLKNRILQLQGELMNVIEEKNKLQLMIDGLNATIEAQGQLLTYFSSHIVEMEMKNKKAPSKVVKVKIQTKKGGKNDKKA